MSASIWHGLFECERAKDLWEVVECWWSKMGGVGDVSGDMHKITCVSGEMRDEAVDVGVWRVLCACMIDVLWPAWTMWAHDRVWREVGELRSEWEHRVRDAISTLWARAVRMDTELSYHIHYVPGSIWSTAERRVSWMSEFRMRWPKSLCEVTDRLVIHL